MGTRLQTFGTVANNERELKDRAHILLGKGQFEGALECYRQLITLNGKDPAYRLRHAEVCARLKRTEAAVGSYRIAAHLFCTLGKLAQARAALHTAMSLAPKDMVLRRAATEMIVESEAPTGPARVFLGRDEAPTEPHLIPVFE